MMTQYHNPVLRQEVIEGLRINPEGIYVDATFGGGGHSRDILEKLNHKGRLFGFDQDADAYKNRIQDHRCEFVASNFTNVSKYLKYYKIRLVDGILADLGVSSHQFDKGSRGFSTRKKSRLDMRMNQKQKLDAYYVLNRYNEIEISKILHKYGELKNAKKIAKKIVLSRFEKNIETTSDLIEIVRPLVPKRIENKMFAMLFQAIRIEVNNEIDALKSFLKQAEKLLKSKGRLVCISYHSLEDRCVKRFIKSGNFEGEEKRDFYGNSIKPLEKIGKLIIPSEEELIANSRARSAKLRIAQKR